MRTLAIELSSGTGSLAWVEDGTVLLEKEWPDDTRKSRPVFSEILAMSKEGVFEVGRIDRFAVGVGPGTFSGLRTAVALVQALAMPDNKPVTAVSSARALARVLMGETGRGRIVVLGDARRNELWAGCFERVKGVVDRVGDWSVAPVGQLPRDLSNPGTVWVSADWDRLGPVLEAYGSPPVELIREARVPTAAMVAALVEDLVRNSLDGESPVPVYVHPAVSVAPRFTG